MKKLLGVVAMLFVFTLAACGNGTVDIDYPVSYDYGTVVSATTEGEETTMTIEVDAFGDVPISAIVVVDASHTVLSLDVESHDETEGWGEDAIEDEEFITSILDNQDDLDSVDVFSGATVTSEALFDVIRTAKAHSETIN